MASSMTSSLKGFVNTIALVSVFIVGALTLPTVPAGSNLGVVSNHLTGGDNSQNPNQLRMVDTKNSNHNSNAQDQAVAQYLFRSGQANLQNNVQVPTYLTAYNHHGNSAYARESGPAASSSPFFGLSSNGEFQLSAYFSQIFWGFVALAVATAVIIWLIRFFFPKESLGGIVQKFKESGTGRSLDLDKLTNVVYGALDTYSKWAMKEVKDGIEHGKYK